MPNPSSFDYAVIRVVPHVEREEFINAGVIVFCRTLRYLDARVALDRGRLAALAPDVSPVEVQEHLDALVRICRGEPSGGPISLLPPAERFHWLVAPRSTVIQTSEVHSGLTQDPEGSLNHLFETMVMVLPPASVNPAHPDDP